jgi:hypothetical protein
MTDEASPDANGQHKGIVELSGLQILSLELGCTRCAWRGEVGDMRVAIADTASTVFACPTCLKHLARYPGPLPDEVWLDLD